MMLLIKNARMVVAGLAMVMTCAFADAPSSQASPFKQWLYWSEPDTYERYANTDLKVAKQENINGYDIVWWSDPLTGVTYPQIASGYTLNQRTRLNNVLNAEMFMSVEAKKACQVSYQKLSKTQKGQSSWEDRTEWSFTLMTPSVISYLKKEVRSCNGDAPDTFFAASTLLTQDARKLSIDDVLMLSAPPSDITRNQSFDTYHGVTLTDWIITQLNTLYPRQMSDESCAYRFEEWSEDLWSLTPEGVRFYPSTDRPKTCSDDGWAVLPWSLMKATPGRLTHQVMP
ncbi:hypothetical protein [Dickeya zeae]|uniref:hypothetical protein n=1 Tax=Dickeya zeae TaxID=204042 RepID=UPI001F1B1869|nr:hypothetical protein [Dickeya zeae]UJR61287.1 hypothetical protein HJ586_03090 [Dickeya zeae]